MTTDVPSGMRPEAKQQSAERRIVNALLDQAARDRTTISPYLRNHLTEHVGAINAWQLLTARPELLDLLDAKAVAGELQRTGAGPVDLSPAIRAALMARPELTSTAPAEQAAVRPQAAASRRPSSGEAPWRVKWAALERTAGHVVLTGHTSTVRAVAFGLSSDGRVQLASGSDDGTVRLWDPQTGQPVLDPRTGQSAHFSSGSGDGVWSVAWAALTDGRLLLAVGGADGQIQVLLSLIHI